MVDSLHRPVSKGFGDLVSNTVRYQVIDKESTQGFITVLYNCPSFLMQNTNFRKEAIYKSLHCSKRD